MSINKSSNPSNLSEKKSLFSDNKWASIISGIALSIWLVPGFSLMLSIHSTSKDNQINLNDSEIEKIEKIVERKISRNTDLVNILLFVLTALPIVGNFYFWLLYKSVREGMIKDALVKVKEEIKEQVDNDIKEKLLKIFDSYDSDIIEKLIKTFNSDKFDIKDKLSEIFNSEDFDIKYKLLNTLKTNDSDIESQLLKIFDSDKFDIKAKLLDTLNPEDSAIIDKLLELLKAEQIINMFSEEICNSKIEEICQEFCNLNMDNNELEKIKNDIKQSFKQSLENQLKTYSNKIISEMKDELSDINDKLKKESENADIYKDAADDLYAQGNYNEAIINYLWASLYQPDNRYFLYKIAESHRQLKEYRSAIRFFNQVIELDKEENKYLNAYFYKAVCQILDKKQYEAIKSLEQAISLKPDEFKEKARDYKDFGSIDKPYNKACFYALIDKTEEALKELEIAVKNQDNKEKAKTETAFDSIREPYYKACFYALIGETEKALDELKKAVEKNQDDKEKAKTETAFDSIRDNEKFQNLIE
ncbi:MAG: tetratricopeptide repeat protein [Cyanobacteria bacterium J06633_8]